MELSEIKMIKGIHPGIFLGRELKKRELTKGHFAMSINVFPSTLGDITLGKRRMNADLAIRIEEALGIEDGTLMILQGFYDMKIARQERNMDKHPDLSKLRKSLFWDTDIQTIDWTQMKPAIIQRIFERGNDREKEEITNFYGKDTIEKHLREAGKLEGQC